MAPRNRDQEDFYAALEDMDPDDLQRFLYDTEYAGATELPWTFGETTAPELGYEAFDLLGMGGGVDIPELTTKGAVDPFDLTQQAKRVNLAQDYGALMLDNILSGMAGPGAYDVGAFTPQMEYGDPLNLVGRRKLETRAQQGGYEGFLAHLELNEGMSPSEAEAKMWEIIETPDDDPDLTREDRDLKKSLLATLPKQQLSATDAALAGIGGGLPGKIAAGQATTGRNAYDTARISETANTMWDQLMEDPEFGYEENGKFYERPPEEIKTPQMEFFDKYGLPYPTASYSDPKYLEATLNAETGTRPEDRDLMAQAFQEEMAQRNQQVEQASGRYKEANTANQALNRAFEQNTEVRPSTEWDAIMEAFRSGGDQTAARDKFRAGPAAAPLPKEPFAAMLAQQFRDLGGTSAIPDRGTTTIRPYVGRNEQGNIAPYSFGSGKQPPPETVATSGLVVGTKPGVVRRGTDADLAAQAKRRQDMAREVQRISGQRQAATYRDPRLAAIQQGAYLSALAGQGRTPLNDAIAMRRQGNRALGI